MTTVDGGRASLTLTCVNCLEPFEWDGKQAYRRRSVGAPAQPVDLPAQTDPRWGFAIQDTFIRCPNEEDGDPHFFPVEFALYGRPVVIGFVGNSSAGKTCLLAAMTGEIDRNRLEPYGLQTEPINMGEHLDYVEKIVDPLFERGKAPPHTEVVDLVTYKDAVLLRTAAGRTFPLVFFDANGESLKGLQGSHAAVRFLHRVDGLVFVADPTLVADAHMRGDPTYTATLASLRWARATGQARFTIPTAIAITKSDLMRFDPPVDQWLNRPPRPGGVDLGLLEQESRDAYAFLHQRGATAWLAPVNQFEQCTLHFVSASGAAYDDATDYFVRPARPRRVLEPLVALLAALDVLDGEFVRGASGF
ncbi:MULTISPECIES: TRAFAC clade GTPase domain-containing protein [Pseudofrankia]|uniref:TRAFAC clade GTPase domain-containing protein n=1 Tax=Pseudofrankia TaxID=2994363 RepID=UPI000234CE6B|nr:MULTISPECIES: hypothetical protein [Pseudofrankia]